MTLDLIIKDTVPLATQDDHHPLTGEWVSYQLRQFPDGRTIGIEQRSNDHEETYEEFPVESKEDFLKKIGEKRNQRGSDAWVNNFDFEGLWRQSVIDKMREMEIKWNQNGCCFSWIDREPDYWCVGDWHLMMHSDSTKEVFLMSPPELPSKRIMRFSLLGGGQIRTIEHFKNPPDHWGEGFGPTYHSKTELKAIAHMPDGDIVTAFGEKYDGPSYEMNAQAVVFRGNRQDIADRVASTFRLIDRIAENFFALFDGAEGCAICGRALRDEISKLIGVGPDCARQYNIPHNREAAERRLALRRKLLGESA